jgi:FAD/FMN-containing dehydrogenase
MIKLQLEWREVLWWMQGGMAGSHLRWSVYEDMVNKVWPQCTEQERRNIHYIIERDFGTYWRNSDGDWKPENEIFDKTPFEYFRQVLARFDPDNQYAVTMRVHSQSELDSVFKNRHMGYLIDWPKLSHVRDVDWNTATVTVRAYKWQDEYRIDWSRRCAETAIVKTKKVTIHNDGTM